MYVPTSMPFVSRTRAIFRSAEFGFFGVIVETRVHTPRRCGAPWSAGVFVFSRLDVRPLRINWFTVGMLSSEIVSIRAKGRRGPQPVPNQASIVAEEPGRQDAPRPSHAGPRDGLE
jgi:hypothetical protein